MLLVDWFFFVVGHILRIISDILSIILSPLVFIQYCRDRGFGRRKFKSILVTGATSGIGRELAVQFANKDAIVVVTGRKKDALDKLKKELSSKVQVVITKEIDVRSQDEMKKFIYEMMDEYQIELIVANAGVSLSVLNDGFYPVASREMFNVNVIGVLNTILPAIAKYQNYNKKDKLNKLKHICVISSLKSYISSSAAGSYDASKAAIRYICDDLRPQLKHWNIDITCVNPGYVESNMTPKEHNKDSFGFLSSKDACKIIKSGLENNLHEINFPLKVFTVAWLLGTLHPIIRNLFIGTKIMEANRSLRYMNIGRRDDMDMADDECYH